MQKFLELDPDIDRCQKPIDFFSSPNKYSFPQFDKKSATTL